MCGTNDPEATLLCVLEKPELTGEVELTVPGWKEFPGTGQSTESKSVPPEGSLGTGAPAWGKCQCPGMARSRVSGDKRDCSALR